MKCRYLTVLSVCLLAGCTPFLDDLNANLKQVNGGLEQVNAGLQSGAGSPSTTLASVDADVCDPVAFKAGFEDRYVADWNHKVIDREGLYRYLSQQRPNDAAAHHNYALYRGKQTLESRDWAADGVSAAVRWPGTHPEPLSG